LFYWLKGCNILPDKFYGKYEKQGIVTVEKILERLIVNFIIPIWEYGKTDPPERAEVKNILNQLKYGRHPSKNIY
jgi:hypothetical protein